MEERSTFHIRVFGRYGLFVLLLFAPMFYFAWPHKEIIGALALQLLIMYAMIRLISTVTVANDGIVLYRVNRSTWQDFQDATANSLLGLPYILVHRMSGRRWWIPLYLTDIAAFKKAIIANAPPGNSIRLHVESNI